jgi:hypothetical protein
MRIRTAGERGTEGLRTDERSGSERPIFLDESGCRARRVRWATRALTALMPAWLGAVLLGALAPVGLPALPVEVAASRAPAALTGAPAVTGGAVVPRTSRAAGPRHGTQAVAFASLTYRFGFGHRGRAGRPEGTAARRI